MLMYILQGSQKKHVSIAISQKHWPANPDTSAQRWTELVSKVSTKLGCSALSILLGASLSKAVVTGDADP